LNIYYTFKRWLWIFWIWWTRISIWRLFNAWWIQLRVRLFRKLWQWFSFVPFRSSCRSLQLCNILRISLWCSYSKSFLQHCIRIWILWRLCSWVSILWRHTCICL
jgi:hypothetical protein